MRLTNTQTAATKVVPVLLVNDGEVRSNIEPREALAIHDTCRLQFPGYQEIAVVVE